MAYYPQPMTYQPMIYAPQQPQPMQVAQPQQQTRQQGSGLIWIQGEAAAKSYLVSPGNTILLMDSENPRFYIKSADASGMPLPLRIFEYKEITQTANAPAVDTSKYITREEFDKRLAELTEKKTSKKEMKVDE